MSNAEWILSSTQAHRASSMYKDLLSETQPHLLHLGSTHMIQVCKTKMKCKQRQDVFKIEITEVQGHIWSPKEKSVGWFRSILPRYGDGHSKIGGNSLWGRMRMYGKGSEDDCWSQILLFTYVFMCQSGKVNIKRHLRCYRI